MEAYMENTRDILIKWLKVLLIAQIVSIATSLMGALGILGTVQKVIGYARNICVVYALFQLARLTERYRKALLFSAVALAGNLLSVVLPGLSFAGLVLSVCTTVASYQEYQGHGEIVQSMDEKLAGKWRSLFWLEFFLALAVSFAAVIIVMIFTSLGGSEAVSVTLSTAIAAGISLLWQLLYISYMKKTLVLLENE